MTEVKTPVEATTVTAPDATDARVWAGAGLCPEAQGDGVPCAGIDGTCDTCGRALPVPVEQRVPLGA